MFDREEMNYFRGRAEAELAMARSARNPGAARAHFHLAGLYLDRAYNPVTIAATAEALDAGSHPEAAVARTRQRESDG